MDVRIKCVIEISRTITTEIRTISEKYSTEFPETKEEMNMIYKERLAVFDCFFKTAELPEVITDKCFIQIILFLEILLCSIVDKLHKRSIPTKKKYVMLSKEKYERLIEKENEKLLEEITPQVKELELFADTMKYFYGLFIDKYPEIYNKYKYK
ncbi:MAG: hypothetical protein WCP52_07625 [Bacteroidota bacterium]